MKRFITKYIFKIGVGIALPVIHLLQYINRREHSLKYDNIVEGFTNLVIAHPVAEEVAKERAKICAACKYSAFSGVLNKVVVDNKTKTIQGLYCKTCGCSISAKIRSKGDYCPRGKW